MPVMKKTVVVCLIAILALAMIGFGFAKWSDSIAVNATVNTGNVDTSIAPGSPPVNDTGPDPQYGPGHNEEGKDVASITCEQGSDAKHITVTIANAYPYYQPGFTFVVKSNGTVPVKIESIEGPNWTGALADWIRVAGWSFIVHNPASNGLPEFNRTVTSDATNSTWEGLVEAIGHQQLHQNGTITVTVNLYIEEEVNGQLCPENASATGTITINSAQWNEVAGI